jgi:hypothetical protein
MAMAIFVVKNTPVPELKSVVVDRFLLFNGISVLIFGRSAARLITICGALR